MTLDELNANPMPFAALMGVVFTQATPDEVRAEMLVRPNLCTLGNILHGGAVMALADSVGAVATVLNLPPGKGTTTIESKTNFLAAGPAGTKVTAVCTPLHRGGRTQVWTTRILREDGRLIAAVTQTQMVL
ncbi:Putative esterase [Alphaproteobacteria bacterium SO-S41]|nr:Putative esterase [Alphaproteobacteria bacterium SO-S41]